MLEPSSSEEDEPDVRRPVHKRQTSRDDDLTSGHQSKADHVPPPAANSNNLFSASGSNTSNRTTSPDASSQGSGVYSSHQSVHSERLQPSCSGRTSSAAARPVSPSPSLGSDRESERRDDTDRAEREEGERKTRLQLYVFVIRCISYPFNAKQPTDITKRHGKVQKAQFEQIHARFQGFVKGDAFPFPADEEFQAAIQTYLQVFLDSDRLQVLVKGGAVSLHDLREIFRLEIKKRIKSLPDPEGSTKEVIFNSWMAKFEFLLRGEEESKKPTSRYQQQQQVNLAAEAILTKDQLYEMFQAVLSIKKFEHQLLFK